MKATSINDPWRHHIAIVFATLSLWMNEISMNLGPKILRSCLLQLHWLPVSSKVLDLSPVFHCLFLSRGCALHLSLVLFHSHTLSRSHTLFLSLSLSLCLSKALSLSHTHTHTHTLSLSLPLSIPLSPSLSLPPSLNLPLSLSLPTLFPLYLWGSFSFFLNLFLALSLFLSPLALALSFCKALSLRHTVSFPLYLWGLSLTLTQRKTHTQPDIDAHSHTHTLTHTRTSDGCAGWSVHRHRDPLPCATVKVPHFYLATFQGTILP